MEKIRGTVGTAKMNRKAALFERKHAEKKVAAVGDEELHDEPCVDGSAGGFPCSNVDLVTWTPFSSISDDCRLTSDNWGWTSDEGVEWALQTYSPGPHKDAKL